MATTIRRRNTTAGGSWYGTATLVMIFLISANSDNRGVVGAGLEMVSGEVSGWVMLTFRSE